MYTDLKSYQNSTIIHDFTVEFCDRYIDGRVNRSDMSNPSDKTHQTYKTYSRQADQMIQAARSGKQNIAEAAANSKQKPKSEPFLLGVASASLKELLEDYRDYLRQHQLKIWPMTDPRALAIRNLYKTYQTDQTDRQNRSYQAYRSYLSDPETACNAMLCLINQTTYLLDNQIKAVEIQGRESGAIFESREQRLRRIARVDYERTRKFDEEAQKVANEAAQKMFGP